MSPYGRLCRKQDTPPRSIALILGPAEGLEPSTRKGSDYAKRAAAAFGWV